jgi:hypothetical protein
MDMLWDKNHAEESENEGMWVAACVELDEDSETPAGSKTPLGIVMQSVSFTTTSLRWTLTSGALSALETKGGL